MRFYAGSSDDEAELPYGVCIATGFEETVRGDGVYYGSLQVRVVHDIDEARSADQVRVVRETLRALMGLAVPASDADQLVTVLGLAPQQNGDGLTGNRVFLNVINVQMGVSEDAPDHAETVERRTELAFASYLTGATS